MEIALCKLNQEVFDITTFCKLEPVLLEKYRRNLYCTKCGGKGYYTRKSRDGKPAYFGAYHSNDCVIKSPKGSKKHDPEMIKEVRKIVTEYDVIDVNFKVSGASGKSNQLAKVNGESHTKQKISSQYTKTPERKRKVSRGLKSLLNMLMYTDTFSKSEIKLDLGFNQFPVNSICVNFDEITKQHLNKWRGYWGVISNADRELNWLNTATENEISIPISNMKKEIINEYKIENSEDLSGAAILVFGKLKVSKSDSKKWYIKVRFDNASKLILMKS